MYTLLALICVVWAAVTWGTIAAVVTLLVFLLTPPLIIAATMRYMKANNIDRYRLNLILLHFELVRVNKDKEK